MKRRPMHFARVMRLLPAGLPGKARLARRILGSTLAETDVELRDRNGCSYLVPSLREPIGFYLLIDRVYERETMQFLLRHLSSGKTFVDVGANIGVFTVPAAKLVGDEGIVLAIEPAPFIGNYLKHNIVCNGLTNIRFKQCAAYNKNVSALAFYQAPVEHFGMGALAAQFDTDSINVPGRTLDDLLAEENIQHVDVLKIDVEGFEAVVFEGARRLLTAECAPTILFEFCDWAEERVPNAVVGNSQRVLRNYGYRIHRLSDVLASRSKPLDDVLIRGFETLLATPPSNCASLL